MFFIDFFLSIDVSKHIVVYYVRISTVSLCLGADVSNVGGTKGIGFLLINGIFVLTLSFALLSVGPTYINAAEVSLYFMIETVLGPVWVYLAGYEAPPVNTVYGGVILLTAMAVNRCVCM